MDSWDVDFNDIPRQLLFQILYDAINEAVNGWFEGENYIYLVIGDGNGGSLINYAFELCPTDSRRFMNPRDVGDL